ncbi:hypothetical protein [Fluviicola sp.]|uniref:hypothetical protein n=1 Tax=Fluviicola sp. TaxID=1917219 RepID=UPI003D2E3258
MLKFSSFLIIILLAFSCTLSAEQENRLNKQLSKYVKSYNNNNTLEYAGLTHPAVVRYYSSLGDSDFIQHFSNLGNEKAVNLDNPLFSDMKSEGNWIERKYTIRRETSEKSDNDYEIYAISSDGGNNWFFLTQEDYRLQKIPLKKRLFLK